MLQPYLQGLLSPSSLMSNKKKKKKTIRSLVSYKGNNTTLPKFAGAPLFL
ncbi:hypothetical protein Hanom_Chr12g01180571 [Helianthus anomalus]